MSLSPRHDWRGDFLRLLPELEACCCSEKSEACFGHHHKQGNDGLLLQAVGAEHESANVAVLDVAEYPGDNGTIIRFCLEGFAENEHRVAYFFILSLSQQIRVCMSEIIFYVCY